MINVIICFYLLMIFLLFFFSIEYLVWIETFSSEQHCFPKERQWWSGKRATVKCDSVVNGTSDMVRFAYKCVKISLVESVRDCFYTHPLLEIGHILKWLRKVLWDSNSFFIIQTLNILDYVSARSFRMLVCPYHMMLESKVNF